MIIKIIEKIKKSKSLIWLEKNKLKFKLSKEISTDKFKLILARHKEELIFFAQQNNLYDREDLYKVNIHKYQLYEYGLSFAQERLWFIEQYEKGSNAYHIPILVSINEGVDIGAIKESLISIVDRHEVLRSVFSTNDDGNDYQVILNKKLAINEYSYRDTDIDKQIDIDINTPFDLVLEYPIRVSIYREELDTKLLINIHHIASDGWSTDVLLKELQAYYDYYSGQADKVD
ncbi:MULTISPECIES: condensation domain-containing protein, partial [unclassified Francisella]|uniref:condensation domain-containing protein n=1 Tax=unclassified Francisella TaxID=2610885 RepID=UPI002E31A79D